MDTRYYSIVVYVDYAAETFVSIVNALEFI